MPIRLCCSARQRLQHNRLHVRRRGRTQRCEVPQHDCAPKRHFSTDLTQPGLRHVSRVPERRRLQTALQKNKNGSHTHTRVGTSESVLSKALKPPSTPPLRGIASLGGSGGCTLHGAADQQHVPAATPITLKNRAESPWCPQQLSFQEPKIWDKHTSSDQSSRNERSQ